MTAIPGVYEETKGVPPAGRPGCRVVELCFTKLTAFS